MKKKGLSPVIATVILISIALILAIIIFLWARSFVSEKTVKFDEPIEYACDSISFEAEASLSADGSQIMVDIENQGDVPLYGVELRTGGFGTVDIDTEDGKTVANGETGTYTFDSNGYSGKVKIVPIIIGESGEIKKAYTCDEKYGVELEVL